MTTRNMNVRPECQHKNYVPWCDLCGKHSNECPFYRAEPPDLQWRLLPRYERELAAERVPNRLYGVTINHEGDAV